MADCSNTDDPTWVLARKGYENTRRQYQDLAIEALRDNRYADARVYQEKADSLRFAAEPRKNHSDQTFISPSNSHDPNNESNSLSQPNRLIPIKIKRINKPTPE